MEHDPPHGLEAELSIAELFMPILMGTAVVLAVVEMNRGQAVQTDHTVKLCQDPVEVMHEIIARVPDVTGVQTDADLFPMISRRADCV